METRKSDDDWSQQQHGLTSPKRAPEQWSHWGPFKSMRFEPGMGSCVNGNSASGHGQGADTSPSAAGRSRPVAGLPVLHLGKREDIGNPSQEFDSGMFSSGPYFPSGAMSFSAHQRQRSATGRDVAFHPAGLRTSFSDTAAATQNLSRSTSLAGGISRYPSHQDYFSSQGGSFFPYQRQLHAPPPGAVPMQQQWWQHPSSVGAVPAKRPSQQQLQKLAFLHSVGERWDAPSLGALLNSDNIPVEGTVYI